MIGKPYLTVQKGWGREEWLANGPAYCGKLLVFETGKRCSFHFHKQKLETLYLVQGSMVLYLEGPDHQPMPHILPVGSVVTIQPYQRHAFQNTGDVPAVLFEVSTQHFEDDSFRIQEGSTDGKA